MPNQLAVSYQLNWAKQVLAHLPENEALLLAAKALELPLRIDSLLFGPQNFTPEQAKTLAKLVKQRKQGRPLQHLLEEMAFRRLVLAVKPGVFIVRPETEMVAEAALHCLAQVTKISAKPKQTEGLETVSSGEDERLSEQRTDWEVTGKVVDLCTGSGAIALAIAQESKAEVWGIEKHSLPLSLAQENQERYPEFADRVHFLSGDATDKNLPIFNKLAGKVDLVVTNPPYVPPGEISGKEVTYDPPAALWGGGNDGLTIPRALIPIAWKLLKPGGYLVMEHAEKQAEFLCQAAKNTGWVRVESGKDLSGRLRYLQAQKPF